MKNILILIALLLSLSASAWGDSVILKPRADFCGASEWTSDPGGDLWACLRYELATDTSIYATRAEQLYAYLPDSFTVEGAVIDSVWLTWRIKGTDGDKIVIGRTDVSEFIGTTSDEMEIPHSYENYIFTMATDPATAEAWTAYYLNSGEGTYGFGVWATVIKGVKVEATISNVTVYYTVNEPPVLASIGNQSGKVGEGFGIEVTATDADGDSIILSAVNKPYGSTFEDFYNDSGYFVYIPIASQSDSVYTTTFIASDGTLADSETITITVDNTAPVFDEIENQSIGVGYELSFRVSATDVNNDSIILSVEDEPYNAVFVDSFNGAGSFTYTPTETQGDSVYYPTFIALDAHGLADSATIQIYVIPSPAICPGEYAGCYDDTLRPTMSKMQGWNDAPVVDSNYKNIDEVPPDEATTYLWEDSSDYPTISKDEGWFHNAWSGSGIIDSVRLVVRAKKTATAGTPKIIFGRAYIPEPGLLWTCSPTDTFTVGTTWADSSHTWSQDPCYVAPWTQSSLNDTTYFWWFRSLEVGTTYDDFGQTNGAVKTGQTGAYITLARFQADFTGTVDSIAMQYDDGSPASNVKYAIYSDSGVAGYPKICMDSTISAVTTNSWRKLALIHGVPVTNGIWYWLAWRHSAVGDSTMRKTSGLPANSGRYKSLSYSAAWPSPIPSTGYTGQAKKDNMIAFKNPLAQNQVTQSFVVVWSHTPSEPEVGKIAKICENSRILKILDSGEVVKIFGWEGYPVGSGDPIVREEDDSKGICRGVIIR